MKRLFVFGLLLTSLLASSVCADEWNVIKSTHFIVYYRDGLDTFGEKVINKVETLYDQIAEYLGFRRHNFWLWDKRARVFIYRDAEDYRAGTGQPHWSSGCVSIKEKKSVLTHL